MKISEIFYSIQGEGRLVGVPSAFVRTTGCNLRCTWCDSPYTSWYPEGEERSIPAILDELATYPTRYVVVTGGEPLLTPEIVPLCTKLRELGYHITTETAATIVRPAPCDLISISPKLANSTPYERDGGRWALRHNRHRLRPDIIEALIKQSVDYQLKFVIDRPEDMAEVLDLLDQLPPIDAAKVLLMPQGVTVEDLAARSSWLAEVCKQHQFRFCPRLHIALYGNKRGT